MLLHSAATWHEPLLQDVPDYVAKIRNFYEICKVFNHFKSLQFTILHIFSFLSFAALYLCKRKFSKLIIIKRSSA